MNEEYNFELELVDGKLELRFESEIMLIKFNNLTDKEKSALLLGKSFNVPNKDK